jgi:hypothetical protein
MQVRPIVWKNKNQGRLGPEELNVTRILRTTGFLMRVRRRAADLERHCVRIRELHAFGFRYLSY